MYVVYFDTYTHNISSKRQRISQDPQIKVNFYLKKCQLVLNKCNHLFVVEKLDVCVS